MKFGKRLLQESMQSNTEWAPFWLNYKRLKVHIKAVTCAAHHATNQRDISESKLEVAFFRDLQAELKKISLFYVAEEKRCSSRFHQLRSVRKSLKKRDKNEMSELLRLLLAFVHFYRDCIRLENFAVMNFQGFSKILKKHDKMTEYNTRYKYMRRKVNLMPFSSSPKLLQILYSTEVIFHEIERDVGMSSATSSMTLSNIPSAATVPSWKAHLSVAQSPMSFSRPRYTLSLPSMLPSLHIALSTQAASVPSLKPREQSVSNGYYYVGMGLA
ncbi:Protein involved in vacuolar polyphosphate accumulation, contains SPX domain [Plasmopara halstedii]|uniref:Protein involved in vacuolar polyphosphate accumulation, contains SPX domain n=1 Tax=Plasmopara halstedii TaxID=4781 RepID=A0A0P1ABI7_PLAHL|nr:Protein involved in vacuolar polyphosphate accumulation, contains SPX domain [Plasmopara halstedii]CEG38112.1 Protein involved in vacuolar polyphosphate accumulation, contains SPX domain [Plasmopara halstedii]|eukprot:XP_024574481.1 Protein involved in vacuolar polyphosphate accumulation, contains SPX domain [Plasmopara halstedii]